MADYRAKIQSTAHATITVGTILTAASGARRVKLWDIILGSEGDAADNEFLHQFQRISSTGTAGSNVTPALVDLADIASTVIIGQGVFSGEPTYTANTVLLLIPLNQRATFRWQVDPRDGLTLPATNSAGIGIKTPTMTALAVSYTLGWTE